LTPCPESAAIGETITKSAELRLESGRVDRSTSFDALHVLMKLFLPSEPGGFEANPAID
jgi:hypothetical protein